MYGIPLNLDLDDIVGAEIRQICIGRYDVQFHFTSGRGIFVQSTAEILGEGGCLLADWCEDTGWSSTSFFDLLNAPIRAYSIPNDKTLEIAFEGNLTLRLYDSSDRFESMQIQPEGIVV